MSDDDMAQAKLYLDSIVGDEVPKVRRDTYLDRGPEVMDFIRDAHAGPVRLGPAVRRLPPRGARRPRPRAAACEPVPLDARFLGDELDRLHPQYTKAPANMIVTQADFRKISLGLRTLRGPLTMVKVLRQPRHQRACCGRKMYAMGNAHRDRPAQGADRRAACRSHYDTELDRPGARGRPGRRRPGHPGRRGRRRSGPAAA